MPMYNIKGGSQQVKNVKDNVSKSNSSLNKRIGAEAFIGTFGTEVFIQVCNVLQGIILARLLGPTDRGQYAAIILWPTIFAYIGLFGVSFAIGRLAAKENDIGPIARTALLLALLTSVLPFFLGYWLLQYLIPPGWNQILPLAKVYLIFIPLCHLSSNLVAIDQGRGNFFRVNLFRSLQNPIYIVFLIMIPLFGLRALIWFVIALLSAFAIVTISRIILMLRDYSIRGTMYPPIRVLQGGLSFGLVGLAVQGYQYFDRILLLWLLEPSCMGLYVIALSASSIIGTIAGSMGLVSFTITAQAARAKGFSQVGSIFRKAIITKFLFGSVLAFAMPFLLPFIYGEEYRGAVKLAIVLIAGSAFASLSLLLDQCMRGQGKPFVGLVGRIAAMIVMIAVALPLTMFWSLAALGVAVAFVLAQFMYLCVIAFQVLTYYNNARVLDFVPKWGDVIELLSVVKRILRSFNLGKYGRWIGLGDDNNVR
jgi:O-antigen/teichoic acid export membrane protein